MTRGNVVIRNEALLELDDLGGALASVFAQVQQAITEEDSVVMTVLSEDLLGHRSPEGGAYVNALIGLARSAAFEGARLGWKVNVVAHPSSLDLSDAEAIEAVSADGLSGQVITLGSGCVGKVIP
jgi:hypothetical protein